MKTLSKILVFTLIYTTIAFAIDGKTIHLLNPWKNSEGIYGAAPAIQMTEGEDDWYSYTFNSVTAPYFMNDGIYFVNKSDSYRFQKNVNQ